MLQVIRERAQGLFVWIIVGLIVVSFALWGVGEYFREEPPIFVAKVNDEPITQMEYQRALQQERDRLQQMLRGADLTQFEEQLKRQALERLIDRKLIVQAAREAGLTVSDRQLIAVLQGFDAFKDENGRFSQQVYEQRIRQIGLSTTVFEEQLRTDLLAEQLVNGVTHTAFATRHDVESVFKLQDQKRDVGVAVFPLRSVEGQIQVSNEEIEAYYREHQDAFQEPERVKLAYLVLSMDDLMDRVGVSDEEIRDYYEGHKDLYAVPEERRVAHILISVPEDGNDADAKVKAERIYQELKQGADFTELAKKYSDDPGSADQGGDLGYIEKGMLDPQFDEVAFALPEREISEPVRTEFGFHIIKVLEVKPGEVKSLDEVRDEIARELRREKAEKLYLDELERLANQTFEHPDSLEPAAEALGLQVRESDWVTRQGGKGLFADPKVLEAAFSEDVLERGYNSAPVELGKDRAVVLRLKERRPARTKPLEAVKTEIVQSLNQEKAAELLAKKGEEFMARVRASEAPAQAAQALGGEWKRVADLRRDTGAELPGEAMQVAFRLPRPEGAAPRMDGTRLRDGGYAVVAVFAVRDGDPSGMDAQTRQGYAQVLRQTFGGDEFNALLNALKAQAEIERYQDRL